MIVCLFGWCLNYPLFNQNILPFRLSKAHFEGCSGCQDKGVVCKWVMIDAAADTGKFIKLFSFSSVGGTLSRMFEIVWGRREYRILIVGLDGAGKTTILYNLQVNRQFSFSIVTYSFSSPEMLHLLFLVNRMINYNFLLTLAIGFNVESITIKNIKFQGKLLECISKIL